MSDLSSGPSADRPTPRSTYHHGDLAAALVAAGVRRAREHGPAGIVVRELAGLVGVVPSAVYRHFPDREHLVAAISQAARERLALALAEGSAGVSVSGRSAAIERFMAIGAAYVAWATSEPRLCETAFVPCSAAPSRPDDPNAWEILEIALDDLVAEGAMPAERRAEAPMVAWTAVHGLSGMLNGIAGPMFGDRDATVQTMLGAIERALEISATR